jgi:hypothetical protein
VYNGEEIEGYCGLCNRSTQVALRQWFACPICWNVVVAYQKGIVAAEAVHTFWRESVTPVVPDLSLGETDQIRLAPFQPGRRSKRQLAEELESSDFVVTEQADSCELRPVFHIELKSGPGAPTIMQKFQLDVNDYNDIVGPVLRTQLPAYIFHVQVEIEYRPPTRRAVARGLWWTDVFSLTDGFINRAQRRDEAKQAMYFDPTVFRPASEFAEQLRRRDYKRLQSRLARGELKLID